MKQSYHSALMPLMLAAPVLLVAALIALPSKSNGVEDQTAPVSGIEAPARAPGSTKTATEQPDARAGRPLKF